MTGAWTSRVRRSDPIDAPITTFPACGAPGVEQATRSGTCRSSRWSAPPSFSISRVDGPTLGGLLSLPTQACAVGAAKSMPEPPGATHHASDASQHLQLAATAARFPRPHALAALLPAWRPKPRTNRRPDPKPAKSKPQPPNQHSGNYPLSRNPRTRRETQPRDQSVEVRPSTRERSEPGRTEPLAGN
jgi:hypothetical protein